MGWLLNQLTPTQKLQDREWSRRTEKVMVINRKARFTFDEVTLEHGERSWQRQT